MTSPEDSVVEDAQGSTHEEPGRVNVHVRLDWRSFKLTAKGGIPEEKMEAGVTTVTRLVLTIARTPGV